MQEFTLREWKSTDAEDFYGYANNKKIADNLRDGYPYPYTLANAVEFLEMAAASGGRHCFRAIAVEGKAVGSIALTFGKDIYCKSAEIGYWLAEPFWGKGIMSRAIRELCEFGFLNYDVVRIFAEPFAHNTGSRRALEKAGFALEGVLKKSVYKNGRFCDSCIYALIKD